MVIDICQNQKHLDKFIEKIRNNKELDKHVSTIRLWHKKRDELREQEISQELFNKFKIPNKESNN